MPLPGFLGRFVPNFLRPGPVTDRQPGAAIAQPANEAITHEKILATVRLYGNRVRFLPWIDQLVEETQEMRQAYRQMLREPYIKQPLLNKVLGVAALDVQVHAVSDNARDREVAEFVRYNITRAKGGPRHMAMSVLFGGLMDGYSVSEKVWTVEDRGTWKNRVRLKQLKAKDTLYLGVEGDMFRNVTHFRDLRTNNIYRGDDFIFWTHLPIFENPIGMSDFRAAYRAYWLIDTAWRLRAIGLERYTLPMLKGEYSDPEQRPTLESALELARSQSWISLPQGAQVEAMELAVKSQSDFEAAIKDLREEMVFALMGAVLHALEGQTTNGRGDTKVHKEQSELLLWMLAAELGDVLTDQLVPQIVDFNYTDADYPSVTFSSVNDAAMVASLQIDQGLQAMGLPLSKQSLYKRYDREEPANDTDRLVAPTQPAGLAHPEGAGLGQFASLPDKGTPRRSLEQTLSPELALILRGLQGDFYAGKMPLSAAIASARQLLGVSAEAAAEFFPRPGIDPDTDDVALLSEDDDATDYSEDEDDDVTFLCGGKGGTPGPCPGPGRAASGPRDLAGALLTRVKSAGESLVKEGGARAAKVAKAAGKYAADRVKELRSTVPVAIAQAAVAPVEQYLFSTAIHAFEPINGAQTAAKLASWGAAKAVLALRQGAHSELPAGIGEDDLAALVSRARQVMGDLKGKLQLPAPVPHEADVRTQILGHLPAAPGSPPPRPKPPSDPNVHHASESGSGEGLAQKPSGPARQQVADAGGADTTKAEQLLHAAEKAGTATLNRLARAAYGRILQAGALPSAGHFLTTGERQELGEVLTQVAAAADLLGRSRIQLRADQARAGKAARHSEATDWTCFDARPPEPLPAVEALHYFNRLVPTLGIDPERWGAGLERHAFTMAAATEETLLARAHQLLQERLRTGQDVRGANLDLDAILDEAGVTPANPQYSQMVVRTNLMDSYNTGSWRQLQEVADVFPVWRYSGIADGRQGADHEPHFGKYYASGRSFAEVRGDRVYNCRCTFIPIFAAEWDQLQKAGATLADD